MSKYKIGSVNVTEGSAVITGSGTFWVDNVSIGDWFYLVGDQLIYTVKTITSNTEIELLSEYAEETKTLQAYEIGRSFTPTYKFKEISPGDKSWMLAETDNWRKVDTLLDISSGASGITKLFTQLTPLSAGNSTSELSLLTTVGNDGTLTIPAALLDVGTVINVKLFGSFDTGASPQGDCYLRIKVNGTTVYTLVENLQSNLTDRQMSYDIPMTVLTKAVSGTIHCVSPTVSIDTTNDIVISATWQFGVADAKSLIYLEQAFITVLT